MPEMFDNKGKISPVSNACHDPSMGMIPGPFGDPAVMPFGSFGEHQFPIHQMHHIHHHMHHHFHHHIHHFEQSHGGFQGMGY